jgi:hypothetical protein
MTGIIPLNSNIIAGVTNFKKFIPLKSWILKLKYPGFLFGKCIVGYIFNAITLIITRKLPVYFIIITTFINGITVNLFYFFTNTFVFPLPGSY